MCEKQSLRSACANAQSDQCLCMTLEHFMTVKLLTGQHLEFLSLKGGCRGSSESTHVKMPHCRKSHVIAHIILNTYNPVDKRPTAVTTSVIYNDILYNLQEMYSFGAHLIK